MDKQILIKVIVGSRLHNLYNDTSDIDYRGIHISPLRDILSPYKQVKNTTWIEGDEDNTSYELTEFCKMATQGNPTILEILFSDKIINQDPSIKDLLENRHKFLDSSRIYEAAKGYAHNQYNKMNLFTPDVRTSKFAVAYLRTLWQTCEFLETGILPCEVTGEMREFLYKVKYTPVDEFSLLVPELTKLFTEYQVKMATVYARNNDKFKPDLAWIEEYILNTYTMGYPLNSSPFTSNYY
jgi:predicted nucleotidyltransferase